MRVDKTYRFDTEDGQATLDDLFRGRSQLLVYHFMFGPDYKAGCPSCSSIADGFDGFAVHLANHDVTLAAVSRAPLAKLLAYRQRMGWHFRGRRRSAAISTSTSTCRSPKRSSAGDVEYNYARAGHAMDMDPPPAPVVAFAATCGTDAVTYSLDRPGMSAFVREDGAVYHTYSTYARGLDGLWGCTSGSIAPRGRNETGPWWRRHDEYARG